MATLISEIERLAQLHADGALSDGEFTAAKARLLESSGEAHGTAFLARCPACNAGIVATLAEQARYTQSRP